MYEKSYQRWYPIGRRAKVGIRLKKEVKAVSRVNNGIYGMYKLKYEYYE
jgi:hypothetical protein